MTDNIENLILEHLKRFQIDLAAARERDSEMLARLGRLEVAIAGLRRDIAHFDEGAAGAEPALGPPSRACGPHRAPDGTGMKRTVDDRRSTLGSLRPDFIVE